MDRDDGVVGVIAVGEQGAKLEISKEPVKFDMLLLKLCLKVGVVGGKFLKRFEIAERLFQPGGLF